MSRTAARETVARLLYQKTFDIGTWEETLENSIECDKLDAKDELYISRLMQDIPAAQERIDRVISSVSERWRIERMGRMDLSILRLAVFEMCDCDDIPVSVSINEAVELAKRYGSDDTPTFINGMLSTLASRLEKGEPPEGTNPAKNEKTGIENVTETEPVSEEQEA